MAKKKTTPTNSAKRGTSGVLHPQRKPNTKKKLVISKDERNRHR